MGAGAEDEAAVFGHGVEGVNGQREEGMLKRGGIGVNRKLRGCDFRDDLVALGEAAAQQLRGVLREGVEVVVRRSPGRRW